MANDLQTKLDAIKLDKETNLLPENLKKGVTCLGVTGTLETLDTSDATALADDILLGKTAYVNGEKVTGTISDYTKIDYSNNNFELNGNMLTIKKACSTIGLSGVTENVLTVMIPDTMVILFKKHKDDCIIRAVKSVTSNVWRVFIYTPSVEGHQLHITCISSPYSSVTVGQSFKVNDNMNSPYVVATDSSGNTYKDDSTIQVSYTYANDCTETSSGSTYSTTNNYSSISCDAFYVDILCAGNDTVLENIAIGSYYVYNDWSIKPETIDDVTMNYKDLSQPMNISQDAIDNTSTFDIDSDQIVDEGTIADEYSSWTWTNPNGITTLDESTYEDLEYQSYIRYFTGSSNTRFTIRSPYIYRHLPSVSWASIYWTSTGSSGSGNTDVSLNLTINSGSTLLLTSDYIYNSSAIINGTTSADIASLDWTMNINYVLNYQYYGM